MERGFMLLPVLALWVLNYFFIVSANTEVDALIAFKNALSNPYGLFSDWNPSLVNPCMWSYIICSADNSVSSVVLGNANLSGELVPQLGMLTNLANLELYSNNISGKIPPELGNLTNLVSLDLSRNKFNGPIPDTLGKLLKLRALRLSNNALSGGIPFSLTTVISLQYLNLSNNNLSGVIPVNGSFSRFTLNSFLNNPNLIPLPPIAANHSSGALLRDVAVGAFFFIFSFVFFFSLWRVVPISGAAVPAISVAWWRRTRRQDPFFDVQAEEDHEVHLGQLKRFSLRELLVATDNFSSKNVLGRGGFAKVYKGRLADGSLVAVKRLKEERNQGGELQFQTEVEMISMAVHCNLLRLIGFCMTPTERLLVYPYMANGSVASCLRERKESQSPLDWPKRKRIALGSALGLAYLHEHCDPKIIHRDVKAANILLDDEFEVVVGDFGLARLMDYKDTHVITAVCGTSGHIAPEYISMGKSSEKTDVFGYGVMLLEVITGQRVSDLAQLANNDGVTFLDWVKGLVKDKKFETLVDTDLQGDYTSEEVEELVQVALLCTQSSSMERPKMSEVVRMLEGEGLAERWELLLKEDVFQQAFNHAHLTNVDFMFNPCPDELSGPR